MPKINVYLPDDLAEAVKETGLPVSAICQRALEQSVKRMSAIRAAVIGDLTGEDPTAGLTNFTQRARDVITLAITRARERGAAEIGTQDLLHAILTEGGNLALHVLRSMEVDPAAVLLEVTRAAPEPGDGPAGRMSTTAAGALELAVTEALAFGHNYVGCEHLLLGLVAEPDGTGGRVLRALGVESRPTRHLVGAVLAGFVHFRANEPDPAAAVTAVLEPVLRRLDKLEERAGIVTGRGSLP
jgi:ATP-dependent Clp protease ATP-binding subunit ClpC